MNDVFLSCDWGTSTSRLRMVETASGQVMGEVVADEGIARVFGRWNQLPEKVDRLAFFQKSLARYITRLEAECARSCEGLTLVVSGMASSSIGMLELPYAPLPIPLSEKALSRQFLPGGKAFPYDILLISGLSTADDVMRGEETELIGLAGGKNHGCDHSFEEGVYIFPGTHSKHIMVKDRRIVDFHTFMTGELFELLTTHSTLQASVKRPEKFDEACRNALAHGLRESREKNFLTGLFKTRTNQLLNKLDFYENYYYLSGLIMGLELASAKSYESIVICAAAKFVEPYRLGAEVLGLSEKCRFVPAKEVAMLACQGQRKVYQAFKQ